MNKKNSASGEKDLRPLALFFFALCILSVAAARMAGFADLRGRDPAPPPLVWQESSPVPGLSRGKTGPPEKEQQAQPQAAPDREAAPAPGKAPARLAPLFFQPIPINQADAELLTTIPGIGPVFARRIIAFRGQQGRITSIDELDAVKGIGPAKLKILKAHLVVD